MKKRSRIRRWKASAVMGMSRVPAREEVGEKKRQKIVVRIDVDSQVNGGPATSKTKNAVEKALRIGRFLLLPIPYLLHEVGHVDLLVFHVLHPRMFQHPPGTRASRGFFFQARGRVSCCRRAIS